MAASRVANTRNLRTRTVNLEDTDDSVAPVAAPVASPSAEEAGNNSTEETDVTVEPPRRYATRRTNNPHPALSAGLSKRTGAEVREEVQKKRDERELDLQRREAELEQRELEVERKSQSFASVERKLKSRRDEDTMERIFDDEDADMEDLAQGEGAVDAGSKSDVENDEDYQPQSDPGDASDASRPMQSEDLEDSGGDDEAVAGTKRKAGKSTKYCTHLSIHNYLPYPAQKRTAKKKKTTQERRKEILGEVERAKAIQAGEDKDEEEEEAARPKARPKSTTNKSTTKPSSSSKSASKPVSKSAPKSTTTTNRATTSKKTSDLPSLSLDLPNTMGLKADWKNAVASRRSQTPKSQASSSATSASPATSSSQRGTPTPRLSAAAHRAGNAKRTRCQDSIELIGGFTDSDITVGMGSAKGGYGQLVQVTQKAKGGDDEQLEGSMKKKRRAKSVVPNEKSLSVQALPAFIQPHWKSTFVPTMLQLIGESENPWVFASGKNTAEENLLIDVVQRLVDGFWPEEGYVVDGMDKIYRIARQAVNDWRARFVSRIKTFVKNEFVNTYGSAAKIAAYVNGASGRSQGLAFWAVYDSEWLYLGALPQLERPLGALQSAYVLKSFATHLAAIQGSRIKETDTKPARGALALAATAVQFVFAAWTTGRYNTNLVFSGERYRSVTTYWHDKSVAKIIERRRFDKYVDMAIPYIEATGAPRVVDDEDDITVCDPSSPVQSDGEDDTFGRG
ncbi:uncharacterized protein B0H18DRAFT_957784 [Fomitopsis serialis]|uniref:uncharacterized protein n=1 Tax=Fomitopsis serialis TaxID=139415 RepID=UPI0020089F28|nr:uncharacterized protein B0H18DRAFT_957784 [Neoantrodia serialis]KAH9918784.1 hypothetical protein B0H18DRAFT_957784 [Neoantrodia serialis]